MKLRQFRNLLRAVVWFGLVTLMAGCASIGLFDEQDQASKLKNLKRGSISGDGLYRNEFYEFEVRLPKGWTGTVGDPPTVLRCESQDKSIDSSVRRFVSIEAIVSSCQDTDTIDTVIERYIQSNQARGFEVVSQRDSMNLKKDARICVIGAKSKESPIKIMSLVTKRDTRIVILECSALRPLFDNFESQFSYAVSNFAFTSKSSEELKATPVPRLFDPQMDYFSYTIVEGDTLAVIAQTYMGTDKHADSIKQLNTLDSLTIGQTILIPRAVSYTIAQGDTYEAVAKQQMQTAENAAWLKEYNESLPWESGQTIRIPLYKLEEPVPREGYYDLARRIFGRSDLSDFLNIYNDGKALNSLSKVRLPLFLFKYSYSYRVQSGDTLAKIAGWATGDPKNAKVIGQYNNLKEPYSLTTGQMIEIPKNLVKDPSVFDRGKSRPKPSSKEPKPTQPPKPADAQSTPQTEKESQKSLPGTPTATPSPRPTATPVPVDSRGIYEPD